MAEHLTHKRVFVVSLPIVLSNATVPILGIVDTGVVGQMGEAAPIGAVGIGAIILTAIYWIFGFLRMGTAGMTAQAMGAKDTAEVAALLTRALLIGFGAGAVLIIVQVPLFYGAFQVSPASPEVEALAREYMAIRIWSAPATIALYGITGWLVALERTRAVLVLQVAMNGTNIVLDIVFVIGFGWGVGGVGLATFLAEWSGLALGLWLCRDAFRSESWRDRALVLDLERLKHMGVVNGNILIRSVLLQAIFVSFMFFGARFDDVQLAANQILLQFLQVTAYAMDGFAFTSESFVGQALGAKSRARVRRAAVLSSTWGLITCIAFALAFAIFGPLAIDGMTTAPDVRLAAREYLPYMVMAPLVGIAAWMLDGIFIGATRTKDMRDMMIVSTLVYFASVLPLMAVLGNHGLWLGLLISFVVRGITLGLRYPALERSAEPADSHI